LQCSVGIEFYNSKVASEVAQLLISNQKKYVPVMSTTGEKVILDNIPLHGDQLFEERCRNTQWTFQNGECPYDRIHGISTEFADWHAKLNLYMVRNMF
jgi:hypothetical protein